MAVTPRMRTAEAGPADGLIPGKSVGTWTRAKTAADTRIPAVTPNLLVVPIWTKPLKTYSSEKATRAMLTATATSGRPGWRFLKVWDQPPSEPYENTVAHDEDEEERESQEEVVLCES